MAINPTKPEPKPELEMGAIGTIGTSTRLPATISEVAHEEEDERDDLKKQLEGSSKDERIDLYNTLETAYESEGVNGVLKILDDDGRTLDEIVEARLEKIQRRNEATPEEIAAMDLQEELDREKKARAAIEAKAKAREEKAAQREAEAQSKELESKLSSAFDLYRYAGKLGDENLEHDVDQMIWTKATAVLDELPEGTPLTREVVRREFRKAYRSISKLVGSQADKKAKETSTAKKAKAKQKAQVKATREYEKAGDQEEMLSKIKGGDLTGAVMDLLKF